MSDVTTVADPHMARIWRLDDIVIAALNAAHRLAPEDDDGFEALVSRYQAAIRREFTP